MARLQCAQLRQGISSGSITSSQVRLQSLLIQLSNLILRLLRINSSHQLISLLLSQRTRLNQRSHLSTHLLRSRRHHGIRQITTKIATTGRRIRLMQAHAHRVQLGRQLTNTRLIHTFTQLMDTRRQIISTLRHRSRTTLQARSTLSQSRRTILQLRRTIRSRRRSRSQSRRTILQTRSTIGKLRSTRIQLLGTRIQSRNAISKLRGALRQLLLTIQQLGLTISQRRSTILQLHGTIIHRGSAVLQLSDSVRQLHRAVIHLRRTISSLTHLRMNRREASQQRIRRRITDLLRHRITHRSARLRDNIRQHIVIGIIRNDLNARRTRINSARLTVSIRLERTGTLQITGEVLRNHHRKVIGAVLHTLNSLSASLHLTPIKRASIQQGLAHISTGVHLLTFRILRALILNHQGTHNAIHMAVSIPVTVQVQGAVQQRNAGHRKQHQNRQNTAGQALQLNECNTQNSHSYSFSAVFWATVFWLPVFWLSVLDSAV